jgi:signal transduction histidine kinase
VRSWLINVYPVKTTSEAVRWVGAIVVEATERKRAEDALRKTEKLAAAGRLAASIAHEINNPLEAVTNLLYLLRHQPSLDEQAIAYADLAQQEISRVAEMTQQTLRFYRQSTLPAVANIAELLDSVLTLYTRAAAGAADRGLAQERAGCRSLLFFRRAAPALRQPDRQCDRRHGQGGHLWLAVRRSRSWVDGTPGFRLVRCGQWLRHDARRVANAGRRCGFSSRFLPPRKQTGTGLGSVGEQRDYRQAQCHGAGRQPSGRSG